MNSTLFQNEDPAQLPLPTAIVQPDYSKLDSAEDILRDAQNWGLVDDLRALLRERGGEPVMGAQMALLRDIAYEFAGAKNRDLAVDVFVHVTGIAEFGQTSLREYARKHGCSHEWFRKEAEAMRRRLGLTDLKTAAC